MRRWIPYYYLGAFLVGVPMSLQFAVYVLGGTLESMAGGLLLPATIGNLLVAGMFRKRVRESTLRSNFVLYLCIGLVNMILVACLTVGPPGVIVPIFVAEVWWLFVPVCLIAGVLMRDIDRFDRRMKSIA